MTQGNLAPKIFPFRLEKMKDIGDVNKQMAGLCKEIEDYLRLFKRDITENVADIVIPQIPASSNLVYSGETILDEALDPGEIVPVDCSSIVGTNRALVYLADAYNDPSDSAERQIFFYPPDFTDYYVMPYGINQIFSTYDGANLVWGFGSGLLGPLGTFKMREGTTVDTVHWIIKLLAYIK